jgi:hemerythrin superfamily protein
VALKDTLAEVVDSAKDLLQQNGHQSHKDAKRASENGEAPPERLHGDAIDLLKEDHRKAEALFKEILAEKSSALPGARKTIAQLLWELTLHAKVEETIFYPAVYGKTKRDSDERLEVLEAYEEHGSMKDMMKKIQKSNGRDESLKAKVQVLSEITEHHVKEEESTFFPEAKRLLGEDRLKALGAEISKFKARAERSKAPKTARRKVTARAAASRKKRT